MSEYMSRSSPRPPEASASFAVRAMDRHAAEWGLASLLLGMILALMALVCLIFNILLGTLAPQIMGGSDVKLAAVGAKGLAVVVLLMHLVSLGCAAKSLMSGKSAGQPRGLGFVGLLTTGFALLLWIVALADLFMILDMMLSRFGGSILG